MRPIHQANHSLHKVIHKAEGTGLRTIAVQGQRLSLERLNNEVADHTAIIRKHPRAVGVENPHHTDFHVVHPLIVKTQGFSDALALVVTTADSNGVHATAIALRLWMHFRIAIDLAGAGEEQPSTHTACETQHVVRAEKAGLGSFDRIELVVNGRCRACQMPDAVTFQPNRIGNVVSDQFKPWMTDPLADVAFAASEVVVEANHLLPGLHQAINQMGANKASPSSHQIDQRPIPIYCRKLPRKSWINSLAGT